MSTPIRPLVFYHFRVFYHTSSHEWNALTGTLTTAVECCDVLLRSTAPALSLADARLSVGKSAMDPIVTSIVRITPEEYEFLRPKE